MHKKKELTQMDKITAGYEKFIQGKELASDGKVAFERTVKNTIPKKPLKPSVSR